MLANRLAQLLRDKSNLKRRLEDVSDMEHLPIAGAGVSIEGAPFVRLQDGSVFYGFFPDWRQRIIYRTLTSRSFRKRIPEEAYNVAWDVWLRYWKGGHIDQQRYYRLKPGDVAIEAGAYIGAYVIKMAQTVGPEGHVVAVEADEENLRVLYKNVQANNLRNVSIVPCGVWDCKGEITFYKTTRQKNSIVPEALRSGVTKIKIRTDTIDGILHELQLRKAHFVIITVNGAEVEALQGMPNTLAAGCHLAIAARYVRDGQPTYRTVVSILEDLGYTVTLDQKGFFGNRSPGAQAIVYASPPPSRNWKAPFP